MAAKFRALEEEVQKTKSKDVYETYQGTLKEVRQIASSPHPVPVLLLLTLERLADQAASVDTRKGEFYRRVYETVKKYESDAGMGGLCLQLLGTPEDEKVASGLTKWLKHRKLEGVDGPQDKPKTRIEPAQAPPPAQPYYPMSPCAFPGPAFPMHGSWFGMTPGPMFQGFGPGFGIRPRAPEPLKKPLGCYICGSREHFQRNCPQKDKKKSIQN